MQTRREKMPDWDADWQENKKKKVCGTFDICTSLAKTSWDFWKCQPTVWARRRRRQKTADLISLLEGDGHLIQKACSAVIQRSLRVFVEKCDSEPSCWTDIRVLGWYRVKNRTCVENNDHMITCYCWRKYPVSWPFNRYGGSRRREEPTKVSLVMHFERCWWLDRWATCGNRSPCGGAEGCHQRASSAVWSFQAVHRAHLSKLEKAILSRGPIFQLR